MSNSPLLPLLVSSAGASMVSATDVLLETVLNYSSEGIFLVGVDLPNQTAAHPYHFRILAINPPGRQLLGLDSLIPLGGELDQSLPGDLGVWLASQLHHCWQQGTTQRSISLSVSVTLVPFFNHGDESGFIVGLCQPVLFPARLMENPGRLGQLLDMLPGLVFSFQNVPPWPMQHLSQGCYGVTGYTSAELLYRGGGGFNQITHAQDLPQVLQTIDMAIAEQTPYEIEYRLFAKDGQLRWVREQGMPVLGENGDVVAVDGFIANITDWKQLHQALQDPLQGVAAAVGDDFFRNLALYLGQTLEVDYILICELTAADMVTTIAHCHHGQIEPNFCYSLAGTPCETVIKSHGSCLYANDIQNRYPQDLSLRDMGAEAYIGVPLRNALGETLGLIVVLHGHPLENLSFIEALLQIFASRLTAELERCRGERILQAAEARWRSLVQHAADLISILDADGLVRYHSPALTRLLGHSPEDLIGQEALRFIHADDLPRVRNQFKHLLANPSQVVSFEFRYRHRQGHWCNLAATAQNLLQDPTIRGLVINSRDIGDRKQQETNLRNQIQFEQLITTLTTQFINLPLEDIDAGIESVLKVAGEFTAADRSYVFQVCEPDSFCVKNTHEWCAPGIEPQIENLQQLPLAQFPLYRQTFLQMRPLILTAVDELPEDAPERDQLGDQDIQSLIVLPLGQADHFTGLLGLDYVQSKVDDLEALLPLMQVLAEVFTNVLERQRSEAALREAEAKYRSIFENAVEGIFQSSADGRYLSVNPALARMYGYDSPAELMDCLNNIGQQLYVDSKRRGEFVHALDQNSTLSNFESRVYRKDGTIIWVSEHARVVRDDQGQVLYYEGTVEDISQSKAAEVKLRQTTSELEAIFQVHPDLYFRMAADSTIVDYKGAKDADLYVSPQDFLGRRMVEVLPPEVGDIFRGAIIQVLRGETPVLIEYALPYPEGLQYFEARLLPFPPNQVVTFIRNISDRKQTEAELRQAEAKYRSIYENATEGIFQSNLEGNYLSANNALARIYGYDSPEDLQANLTDIATSLYVDPNRRHEFTRLLVEQGSITEFESQIYRKDGQIIWISENARAVHDAHGELSYFEGTVIDITERKLSENTIHYQAFHDLLTGLPNRALFDDRLPIAIADARRRGDLVAVMFLDLDRFKTINDTLGHAVGDRLLQDVAERISHCLREVDTVARWGGDEFTLLLPHLRYPDDAVIITERILHALKPGFYLEGHHLHVTTSIGIALYPSDGTDPDTLLRNADAALYRAKESGRNNYQFYTANLNSSSSELLRLENQLHQACDRDELRLYYQPQIATTSGDVIHVEALARWQHPEHGLLSPKHFIAIAEENGLIVSIGEWVLHRACQDCSHWQNEGLRGIGVSVNLSSRQFLHPNLVNDIRHCLETHRLSPHLLTLEITETIAMQNLEMTKEILLRLRNIGVGIALDDFGMGYSSLNYLKQFPLTSLKMDRSFVQDLSENAQDVAIARAILALGKGLNLNVVAEGVETVEQLDILRELGCDLIQGFFYSRPIPYDRLFVWLQTYNK